MTRGDAAPASRGASFRIRSIVAITAVACTLVTSPARAQNACSVAPPTNVRVTERSWPAPLDRRVTLRSEPLPLRDGLARLADAAHVKLSYVAELLPLDRPTCLAYRAVAAGDVLAELLRGTGVEPVIAGDDQVVLAPTRAAARAPQSSGSVGHRASVLDRVIVTGTAAPHPQRFMPVSLDVIPGERLAQQGTTSLSQMLDGAVPGVWMWQQSPTTLLARYGSVRGASSFGVSYPKMYIDGIEVANPLLVRQLDASAVDRVEVVRGPQGAALYGADANSGVINIITRHDGAAMGSRLLVESTAGVSGSQFAPQDVLTQQHALAFRAGTAERSGGFGLSVGTLGAYIPGAFAHTLAANGDVRVVGSHSILTGVARVFSERAGSPANPVLPRLAMFPGPVASSHDGSDTRATDYGRVSGDGSRAGTNPDVPPSFAPDSGVTQAVSQYTVGGTLAVAPNDRWTHTIVLGIDGYRLSNPALDAGPIPSASDSALAAAEGGSDRVTARLTSAARFGAADGASTVLTFTAEHAAVREQGTIASMVVTRPRPGEDSRDRTVSANGETSLVGWYGNSGLVAQASSVFRDRLFLTAGVRLERDAALVGSTRMATLPMLAGALVGDRGDLTVKLRAAYGESIRPVQGTIRELAMSGRRTALVASDLAPERQGGVEVGADLFVGRTLALHVTRFDQRATDLIQSVPVTVAPYGTGRDTRADGDGDGDAGYEVAYQLQNVGAIANRGWEMQTSAIVGRLTLGATLALVDSRIARTGTGYSGELRVGDRTLGVPARTASLTGSWTGRGWFSSLTVARASDWVGYDRIAVANALTSATVTPADLVGDGLRTYWREYDGVTRVRATFSRDLFRGLALVFTGDNLLGQQRGEPDNATVVPGRTITAGVRAKF